jgi:multicomponent Na+:H+ antiporter subunit A
MLWAVLAGFALAIAAPWINRAARNGVGFVLGAVPALIFVYFASYIPAIAAGETVRQVWPWVPAMNISLSFYLDGLSLMFALLISGIGTIIVVYAGTYLADHPFRGRFYVSLLAFMASMLGVVLSDNVISLFVFWELTSLTSYLLIGFDHGKEESRKSALQALLVTGIGGLALLGGLILLAVIGGSWELSTLLNEQGVITTHPLYLGALLCVLAGAFTKSAQFPFHFWLPNAMAAPTPVSAYLHSSTMVKAGVYLLARLSPAMGGTEVWMWALVAFGGVTMVVGAYMAITQVYLKRILAYSTVSALGMLVLLIGLVSAEPTLAKYAAAGFASFLLAHALYKATLFLVAGTITHETDEKDVTKLGGLRTAMPLTAAAAVLAALSMAGIPPLFGFISKELLFETTLGQTAWRWPLTIAAVVTGIFFVIVACLMAWQPFFGKSRKTPKTPHEAPPTMWIGPAMLALLGLAIGVFPSVFGDPVLAPITASLQLAPAMADARIAMIGEVHFALWHGVNLPLVLSASVLAVGVAAYAAHGYVLRGLGFLRPLHAVGPEQWYRWSFDGTVRIAKAQTLLFQNGYLRSYIAIMVATFVALVTYALYTSGERMIHPDFSEVTFYEVGLAVLIIAAALAAVNSKSSLGAVAAMGVIGYGVALMYVNFGAPDLAMTQFAIETVTVILFVLVFYHLPPFRHYSGSAARLKDTIVALTLGVLMTLLVLTAVDIQYAEPISDFFATRSYEEAHGRNVVNVILVDFRAIDTLGEITVVALAGVGVYALLKLRARGRTAVAGDAGAGGGTMARASAAAQHPERNA